MQPTRMCLDKIPKVKTEVTPSGGGSSNGSVNSGWLRPVFNAFYSHFLSRRGYHKRSVRLQPIFFSIHLLEERMKKRVWAQ